MPAVNPDVLCWARDSAGLTKEEAAARLQFRDASSRSAIERLEQLESGAVLPSRSVLARMARQYRRPLVALYLAEPPPPGDRSTDFRTLDGAPAPADDAAVQTLVRQILASQSTVREVLLEEEADEVDLVGSLTLEDGRAVAIDHLEQLIGAAHPRSAPNPERAFRKLRSAVHEQRVFVLLKGDLGSHHTAVTTEQFRGFALADRVAPFIVVNPNDARAAWSFTLVHELVHLLLGNSGISALGADNEVERFCNGAAAEYLLPLDAIEDLAPPRLGFPELVAAIDAAANTNNVSRPVVAYRLRQVNRIDGAQLRRLLSHFRQQWLSSRTDRSEVKAERVPISPYRVKRHRAGEALLDLVRRAHGEGALPTTRAAVALGVKSTQVRQMLDS